MKICFFNTMRTWGGGEKWHYENAVSLHRRGEDVLVVADGEGELSQRLRKQGVRVFPLKVGNFSFLNIMKRRRVLHLFQEEQFDAVLFNAPNDLKIGASIAKKIGIRKRVFRRGSPIPIRGTWLNRYLFSCLTDVLTNSEATKRSVLESDRTLFPEDRIKVIYNGIQIPIETEEVEGLTTNDVPVIGSLGRLEKEKGHDFLVEVASELKRRGESFKIRIGGEGRQYEYLRQKIVEKDVSSHVELVGFVRDTQRFLRGLDVFVMPSRWEGFGNVLVEAMICKKPLVGWNHSGLPELIKDGENGFLVEFGNITLLADAIGRLLKEKKLREEMGENGFVMVKQKFDMDVALHQLEEYLKS